MRYARLGPIGQETPVVITDSGTFDLSSVVEDINGAAFASGSLDLVPSLLASGVLDGGKGAVYCIGMNYAAHAAESGSEPPKIPILFLKPSNTVVGPFDDVDVPKKSLKTDWEVELGVVIGENALYLESPEDAAAHIAGYVTANDLSEREFQLEISGGQWSKGKASPGFTPVGPWLVTPDEVDGGNLRLRSWVNGEPRQDSSTADLIFGINHIIWHLSQYMELEAGDLILTGTPEGVALSGRFPYIAAGDVVEIDIEGLGRQRTLFGQA